MANEECDRVEAGVVARTSLKARVYVCHYPIRCPMYEQGHGQRQEGEPLVRPTVVCQGVASGFRVDRGTDGRLHVHYRGASRRLPPSTRFFRHILSTLVARHGAAFNGYRGIQYPGD